MRQHSLVALIGATAIGLLASPVQAETWHAPDLRGDVSTYTYSPEPPPCGTSTEGIPPTDSKHDIRKLAVDHGADAIELRLSLGEVRASDASSSYTFHVLVPRGAFIVNLVRFEPGKPLETFFSKEPDYDSVPADECGALHVLSGSEPCDGLTVRASAARDRIEVVLPRSCVKDPRWVKVGASVTGFTETDPSGSSTSYNDHWAEPGHDSSGFLPPYGPRVRRAS